MPHWKLVFQKGHFVNNLKPVIDWFQTVDKVIDREKQI